MQKMPFLRFFKLEIGFEQVQPESSKKEKKQKYVVKHIFYSCVIQKIVVTLWHELKYPYFMDEKQSL